MGNAGNDKTGRRGFLRRAAAAGAGLIAASQIWLPSMSQAGGFPSTTNDVLIAYLTRTNNTKTVAEIIRQEVGGTMVEIEPATPYPEDYDALVAQVDAENERGYTPPLKRPEATIQDHDTVFVGFPTWDMQLPPPMKRFLQEHDLRGKTVVPFNTHGGYGVGSGFRMVDALCPDADVLQGFSTRGGLERDSIYLAIEGERRAEVRAEVTGWLRSTYR